MTATDLAALPAVGMMTISNIQYLTLTYHQNATAVGLTATPKVSTDLVNWTAVSMANGNGTISNLGTDSLGNTIYQVAVPVDSAKKFLSLSVSMP